MTDLKDGIMDRTDRTHQPLGRRMEVSVRKVSLLYSFTEVFSSQINQRIINCLINCLLSFLVISINNQQKTLEIFLGA